MRKNLFDNRKPVEKEPVRPPARYQLRTVVKAVHVLELFLTRERLTLTDACRALELGVTVAYRLLHTWVDLGYLTFDPAEKVYRLGSRLLRVATRVPAALELPELASRLRALSVRVQQTSNVGVLEGKYVAYIARHVVRRLLTFDIEIGSLLPAHATSMGRLLLAYKPESWVRQLYPDGVLPTYTEHTFSNVDSLLEELHRVRELGYAVSSGHLEDGVSSVAVPLRDRRGRIVAALNVAGPSNSFSAAAIQKSILPALREAAAEPVNLGMLSENGDGGEG